MLVKSTFLVLVAALALGFSAPQLASSSNANRADCPGKVICPLTGEKVCRDQCPLIDANRPDCPGKVECPLGGLVCADRCPLDGKHEGKKTAETKATPRACCVR